jgi:hypothetical protein
MKKALLLSLGLMLIASAALLAAVDVTGDWEMTSNSPRGPMTRTISFVKTGDTLTYKTVGRNNEEITAPVTVNGNELEWTVTRTGPQGEMKIVYKAKVEGDKMTGTSQFGDRPASEWTAVRKPK